MVEREKTDLGDNMCEHGNFKSQCPSCRQIQILEDYKAGKIDPGILDLRERLREEEATPGIHDLLARKASSAYFRNSRNNDHVSGLARKTEQREMMELVSIEADAAALREIGPQGFKQKVQILFKDLGPGLPSRLTEFEPLIVVDEQYAIETFFSHNDHETRTPDPPAIIFDPIDGGVLLSGKTPAEDKYALYSVTEEEWQAAISGLGEDDRNTLRLIARKNLIEGVIVRAARGEEDAKSELIQLGLNPGAPRIF